MVARERGLDVKRIILASALASAGFIALAAGPAFAGPPASHGCVGESVSANAQAIHPYGSLIRDATPRNELGTLGDAVHAVQAGALPDDVYWNTCND